MLVVVLSVVFAGNAFADGPGVDCKPPAKCDADAYADANASVTINGPTGSVYAGLTWVTINTEIEFDSVAGAEAAASIAKGMAAAYTYASTDGLAYYTITDPNGNVIASDFSYVYSSDWDYDFDVGKPAIAAASAYSGPLTITFSYTFLPTELGAYEVYAYGDSIAWADAYSGSWFWWLWAYCEDHGFDFAWDEAFYQLWVKAFPWPHMKLEFRLDPGCVVEAYPYADYAAGRKGPRVFEQKAYIQDDPYVPGGKYEPAVLELLGGVVYYVEAWCPAGASELGEGIISSADFHIGGRVYNGYQQIWPLFQNQAPGVFDGFYVTGGLD